MKEGLSLFIEKVNDFEELKSSQQIDYFAYYFSIVENENYFQTSQIKGAFEVLRLIPYSNISKYLSDNCSKPGNRRKKIKYLKSKRGYHLESKFEDELKENIIFEEEKAFINFKIDPENLEWKPSDIPFVNSKVKKNANFFTTLYYLFYHLENSLRKFLIKKLSSIIGNNWEVELCEKIDLTKAQSIRREVNLTEMLPERGDNILYYCMWEDYAKIIKEFPNIFRIKKESDEVLAHLNSMAKIRNAIAHNASTIPKEYQDELTIFLKKYIKILRNNEIG